MTVRVSIAAPSSQKRIVLLGPSNCHSAHDHFPSGTTILFACCQQSLLGPVPLYESGVS